MSKVTLKEVIQHVEKFHDSFGIENNYEPKPDLSENDYNLRHRLMAEENESQEKTEEPSQRKLEQAKEDGKVLTSKEMYIFTTLAMALLFMTLISMFIKPQIMEWSALFQFDQQTLDQFGSIKHLQLSKLTDAYLFIFKITVVVGFPMFLTV